MSDRPLRVVLDATAVTAFCRGSISVGEVLAEVEDERAAAGLPVLSLAEARRTISDTHRLHVLLELPATRLVGVPGEWWPELAATSDIVGRLEAAAAITTAITSACVVLTAAPGLYAGFADGGPVIAVDDEADNQ